MGALLIDSELGMGWKQGLQFELPEERDLLPIVLPEDLVIEDGYELEPAQVEPIYLPPEVTAKLQRRLRALEGLEEVSRAPQVNRTVRVVSQPKKPVLPNDYLTDSLPKQGWKVLETEVFDVAGGSKLLKRDGILPPNLRMHQFKSLPPYPWAPDAHRGEFFIYDPDRIQAKLLTDEKTPGRMVRQARRLSNEGWNLQIGRIYDGPELIDAVLAYRPRMVHMPILTLVV